MPKISADVSEATGRLEPLKPGDYEVECKSAEAATSSSGNPVVKLELAVVDGPDQGTDEDGKKLPPCAGRGLPPKYLPLTGKGAGILVAALEGFGVAFTKRGDKVTFDTDDLVGSTANVVIGKRIYQGDEYPEIKRFKKAKA